MKDKKEEKEDKSLKHYVDNTKFLEAMKECKLRQATILTLNQEEKLETEAGLIHVLPARTWPPFIITPTGFPSNSLWVFS